VSDSAPSLFVAPLVRLVRTPQWVAFVVTSLVRSIVAWWAWGRFPPVADGAYYAAIAERIADGHGSTWLWPDGAVTYAAHYPVGLPALIAALEVSLTRDPSVVSVAGVLLGAVGAAAVADAATRFTTARRALSAGVVFGVHPAMLTYVPAVMTEGLVASLLAITLGLALRSCDREGRTAERAFALLATGAVIGAATYLRPQCLTWLALAPMGAWVVRARGSTQASEARRVLVSGLVPMLVAATLVAPWTLRNCEKMNRCALVSVNGGWNLLIGTNPAARGTWAPLEVPVGCREVFDEAAKDECFGREAREIIASEPTRWVGLLPAKWAATFDYLGAGPAYLHSSSPRDFGVSAKWAWGALETVVHRVVLALSLLAVRPRSWGRRGALLGLAAFLPAGWIATLGFSLLALAVPIRCTAEPGLERVRAGALAMAGAVVLSTALVHGVFFGAGRYGLVVVPALCLAAVAGNGARLGLPTKAF
jgi:hypothetical protein